LAAAPAYLKERVKQEAALPLVVVGGAGKEGRRRKRKGGKERGAGGAGAKKRRRDGGKENEDGKEEEGEESAAKLSKAKTVDSTTEVRLFMCQAFPPSLPPSFRFPS